MSKVDNDGWAVAQSKKGRRRAAKREKDETNSDTPRPRMPSPSAQKVSETFLALCDARAAERASLVVVDENGGEKYISPPPPPNEERAIGAVQRIVKSVELANCLETAAFEKDFVIKNFCPRLCLGLGLGSVMESKSFIPQLALFLKLATRRNPSNKSAKKLIFDPVMGARDVNLCRALGCAVPNVKARSVDLSAVLEAHATLDGSMYDVLLYLPHCPHALTLGSLVQAMSCAHVRRVLLVGNPVLEFSPTLRSAPHPIRQLREADSLLTYEPLPDAFHGLVVTCVENADAWRNDMEVMSKLFADVAHLPTGEFVT
eukprot:PhM_4_TR8840/c0_g3_i1/m.56013